MNSVKKVCFITGITCIIMFSLNFKSLATTQGAITEFSVRLRKEASTSSDIIMLLAQDDKVEVLEQNGDWYKIKSGENTGYVYKDYIKLQDELKATTNKAPSSEKSEETSATKDNTNENSNIDNNDILETKNKTINVEQSIYIVPLINSSVIYKMNPNTRLTVIEEVNGWSYITSEEVSGWIRSDKLVNDKTDQEQVTVQNEDDTVEEETIETEKSTSESKTGYIKVDGANLRKNAATTADILTVLYRNTQITVLSTENGWSKVKTDNLEGYVSAELISDTKVVVETTSRSTEETRGNTETESSTTTTTTNSSTRRNDY